MGLDTEVVVGIVVLTILAVLLTGPGMWSEKWGWSALRRRKDGAPRPEEDRGSARRSS